MVSVEKYINFSIAISNIEKSLQKYKNDSLAEYGLRSTHLLCMIRLKDCDGGMTAVDLAEVCSVNKALISRITVDLLEKGYVEYSADSLDKKYKRRLKLTEAGQRVTEEISERIHSSVSFVSGDIPESKLALFYDVLFTMDERIKLLANNNENEEK